MWILRKLKSDLESIARWVYWRIYRGGDSITVDFHLISGTKIRVHGLADIKVTHDENRNIDSYDFEYVPWARPKFFTLNITEVIAIEQVK